MGLRVAEHFAARETTLAMQSYMHPLRMAAQAEANVLTVLTVDSLFFALELQYLRLKSCAEQVAIKRIKSGSIG